jgi:SAM-dependent methyltransferase
MIVDSLTHSKEKSCWICGGSHLDLFKPSNLPEEISSRTFAITDSHYGVTATIYRCSNCGFMQCSDMVDILPYYEQLEDEAYEKNRRERSLQQRKLLGHLARLKKSGRLLDIGAGSGMLVEQALQMGYLAEGIEPSVWLQKQAREWDLPVHLGTFPHPDLKGSYDCITLVDILEHLANPIDLLRHVRGALAEDGIGMVITPDVNSLVTRLFGMRWWHFRAAHIGYFNRGNLLMALEKAGLEPLKIARPGWYFSADYVAERLKKYLPGCINYSIPPFLKKVTVPVNFYDSLLILFQRKRVCS